MATIPTQNAVPSEAPRDLKFNSGKIDEFVTSLEHEYKDRFGRCHMTIEGMRWIFDQLMERFQVDINQAIIAAGYIPMDSFQQGAEITKRNEILRDETTGEYYRWDGDLPKTVPAGSTPESAGGVGVGAWVSVGDASLRSDLLGYSGYRHIPSIESQLIPEIKKSYFMADALGITPDINDCATVINNLIQNGVRKILFPAGLYRFSSVIKVTDNTKIIDLSSNGVSVVGLLPHALPNPITNEYCVKNNIVIFYNEITDFFEGTCILDVKNIAFLGLVNDNSKNNRYNAHTCFKESGGSLYVKPNGCLFYKWGVGLDLKEMSHSKKIISNKFQHCKIAVDLSGVVFNSFVEHNFFVENDIGVKLGSGSQVSVSDNEFALDAEHETIGIVSDAMSGISFNRNYFEDYGDKSKPKYGIGALAYDIKFNPYVYSPDSISIFGNTINMQDRSDYCFRLDNFNRLLKLPLFDFTLSNNKSIGYIKSHVYIPDYSNLGLCLDGLTVTGDYYDARKKYNASFGEGGNRISGNKGVSCEKLSTGKYRLTVEFGTGSGERLCSHVSPLINIPVFSVIEDTTPNTIVVAIFNMKGEPLDCPFMVSTSQ